MGSVDLEVHRIAVVNKYQNKVVLLINGTFLGGLQWGQTTGWKLPEVFWAPPFFEELGNDKYKTLVKTGVLNTLPLSS